MRARMYGKLGTQVRMHTLNAFLHALRSKPVAVTRRSVPSCHHNSHPPAPTPASAFTLTFELESRSGARAPRAGSH